METGGNGDREKMETEMRRGTMETGEDRTRVRHSKDGDWGNMETGVIWRQGI